MAAIRLPTRVWSATGPIPVRKKKGLVKTQEAYGLFDPQKREIHLELTNSDPVTAATFCHELTHVALWDSGVGQMLSEAQTEAICDALGQYLGGMMIAGGLTIRAPKGAP